MQRLSERPHTVHAPSHRAVYVSYGVVHQALVQQEMSQTGADQAPAGGFGLFAATTGMGGDATQLLLEPANEPQGPLAPSLDPRLDEETPIRIR